MALAQVPPAEARTLRVAPSQRVSQEDGHTLIWLEGEHDIASLFSLADALAKAIACDDHNVVVDLSAVQFMGAETIGVLIRGRNLLRTQSREMTVRAPAPCAQRVLDLCQLGDFVPHLELVTAAE